jgi:hypothetical protein
MSQSTLRDYAVPFNFSDEYPEVKVYTGSYSQLVTASNCSWVQPTGLGHCTSNIVQGDDQGERVGTRIGIVGFEFVSRVAWPSTGSNNSTDQDIVCNVFLDCQPNGYSTDYTNSDLYETSTSADLGLNAGYYQKPDSMSRFKIIDVIGTGSIAGGWDGISSYAAHSETFSRQYDFRSQPLIIEYPEGAGQQYPLTGPCPEVIFANWSNSGEPAIHGAFRIHYIDV